MKLKNIFFGIFALSVMLANSSKASAQYYEIANQLPNLISPALSGSMNYKGFIEGGYNKTFGKYDADFIEINTSQGFQYNSWFYMGVGLGVDVIFAHKDNGWGNNWSRSGGSSFDYDHSSTSTAAMVPIFTDFRFNIGTSTYASFFMDLKVGCSFLLGKDYVEIGSGYLTNQQYFYLHPSFGVRIPTNSNNKKQAVDLSLNYKLLTSNYWNGWSKNVTLNAIGASIAYEW